MNANHGFSKEAPTMRRHTRLAFLAFGLAASLMTAFASAQPKPAKPPAIRQPAARGGTQGGVLQLGEITITGRPQRPIAAVDVSKIPPKLMLAELKQPFIDRIEEAAFKEPF